MPIHWSHLFSILLLSAALSPRLAAAEPIPVIHCTDLYHPHEDPDDHFDLASMYALRQIDLKAIILDQGARQAKQPGSTPVRQMNQITGRNVPWAIGLSRNLASPADKVPDDRPEYQRGVEMILKVLRESPTPVSIVSLGSCRDIAAAFNREPELLARKVGKLIIFIGEADERKQDYREYNVNLDRQAFICILRSGLPVHWVPCFDGGLFKNNGHASYWAARHADLLGRCSPDVIQFFTYALERKDPSPHDPLRFLAEPANATERERLLAGKRNLWCTAVFVHLAGQQIVQQAGRWAAIPIGSAGDARPIFAFREVEVSVDETAAIRYGPAPLSRKVMRFEVLDPANYPAAMTAVTAELLTSLGERRP